MFQKSMLAGALLVLSSTIALGGPCNTASRDAGSGPVTIGKAGETTGVASSNAKEHPPTEAMKKATEGTAASSQDAQRQMQSQPTAAEQSTKSTAADASKSTAADDEGC
ncbi:putative membrane protein [Bradyrhizobium sp. USDA 377]